MMVAIFHNTYTKVCIYTDKEDISDVETVIVKANEEVTYSEMIRSMKEEVKTGKVTVDSITSNEEGTVILKVRGAKQENRKKFREDLKDAMKDKVTVFEERERKQ